MKVIPTRVDSITLAVRDFSASVAFYEDVFGFEKQSQNEILARFVLDNLKLDLIQAEVLESETGVASFPAMPGPITIAIAMPEAGDVDACQVRAEAAGVRVLAPAEDKPSGPRILFLCDPDGHIWEVGHFPPDTWTAD
jgi:catechol 2,3-dioxygenase-like lactoylglutathione lyase family enzyme